MCAGAAKAALRDQSLAVDATVPSAAVGQPSLQPVAGAQAVAPGAVQSAQVQDTELAGDSGSHFSAGSSVDVLMALGSTRDRGTQPADMTRAAMAGSAVGTKDGQGVEPALQPVVQPRVAEHAAGAEHAESKLVRGLADPNKRLLARMGSTAPADASKHLLQEVGARSQVQGLLQVSSDVRAVEAVWGRWYACINIRTVQLVMHANPFWGENILHGGCSAPEIGASCLDPFVLALMCLPVITNSQASHQGPCQVTERPSPSSLSKTPLVTVGMQAYCVTRHSCLPLTTNIPLHASTELLAADLCSKLWTSP